MNLPVVVVVLFEVTFCSAFLCLKGGEILNAIFLNNKSRIYFGFSIVFLIYGAPSDYFYCVTSELKNTLSFSCLVK